MAIMQLLERISVLLQRKVVFNGFIIDDVIRDLSEITNMEFPPYANGALPFPGK
jgi:regulator of RNase E activity RraA